MSSPSGQGQVRQRTTKDKKRPTTPNVEALAEKASEKVATAFERVKPYKPEQQGSEWDYKLAISVITVLAFITRFWGIRHPDQVVFDEVHFGKVSAVTIPPRTMGGRWLAQRADRRHSSLPTTCKEPTSSTSTLPSESSYLHSLAGSSDTRATFCSRTLAIRTSPTRSPMSHTAPCPPRWALLPFQSSFSSCGSPATRYQLALRLPVSCSSTTPTLVRRA